MGPQEKTYPSILVWLKLVIFAFPATLLACVKPSHGHALFGLSLVLGAILQAFIPPRKKGLILIACTSAFALIYSMI